MEIGKSLNAGIEITGIKGERDGFKYIVRRREALKRGEEGRC